MRIGVNPFRKNDRDSYPEVVIPLARAPSMPKASPDDEKLPGPDEKIHDRKSLDKSSSSEENGAAPVQYGELTLESLRAEVEADSATSGQDSSYDRMFFLGTALGWLLLASFPAFLRGT